MKIRHEVLKDNIFKARKLLAIVLSVIAVFEIGMLVYGAVKYDFNSPIKIIYYVSYIVLFFASAIGVFLLYVIQKKNETTINRWCYYYCYFYVTLIILWSLTITYLDMRAGSYPFVYLTVCLALPFFLLVNPIYYICLSLLGYGCMVAFNYYTNPPVTAGFCINLAVFTAMVILITIFTYKIMLSRYDAEKQLYKLSITDQLTDLRNRRSLDNTIDKLVKGKKEFVITLLDINNFKQFNDKYGHETGDEVLVKVSKVLKSVFGDDNCFRYGGDEIAIISLRNISDCKIFLEGANKSLASDNPCENVSFGAGLYQVEPGDSTMKLFTNVDKALYKAKSSKTSNIVVYEK